MALGLALAQSPASAQDAEALRKQLEEMRKQMETISERLHRLETQPKPVAAQAPAVQPPAAAPPSLLELARPRQPFALYERRGAGQLLFDIGVSADFVGNLTQRNVDKANAGTFANRENRFFPREVELSLFGQIDPYASGVMRIETGEEEPGAEARVNLADAYLTLLTLPYGTQLRIGQVRNRFGLLNEHHRDGLPQPDVPNVLLRFLGEEGLVERGVELTWVAPFPFYLETLFGIFNGDNEAAFGRGKLSEPLLTGRVRTFFDLTDTSAIQFGASVADGQTPDRQRGTLVGLDLKYKYRPEGWLHPLVTLGGEGLYSVRRVEVLSDDDGHGEQRTRHRSGWYAYGEVQPFRRWAGGVRYDSTQYPVNPGREWAVEPYVTFWPSEFLRFRLAYKRTDRDKRDGFTDNGGSARIVDEILFQSTFILGAHPAHPF
jgi:hypothetical protein